MTQKDLARLLRVGASTVAMYETGAREPDIGTMNKLADLFGVSIDYLVGQSPGRGRAPAQTPDTGLTEEMQTVPVLGRVKAGVPLLSEQNITGRIEVPARLSRRVDFALEVSGDSMIGAGIQPGDIVFCQLAGRRPPVHGDIVVAMVDQGEMTLKRYVKRNGRYWLMAENPAYEPIPVDDRVQVQGVFVARYTEFGGAVEPPPEDMTADELITRLARMQGIDPDALRHLVEAARALRGRP